MGMGSQVGSRHRLARYAGHRFPGADHPGQCFRFPCGPRVEEVTGRRPSSAARNRATVAPKFANQICRLPSSAGAIGTNNDSADTKREIGAMLKDVREEFRIRGTALRCR